MKKSVYTGPTVIITEVYEDEPRSVKVPEGTTVSQYIKSFMEAHKDFPDWSYIDYNGHYIDQNDPSVLKDGDEITFLESFLRGG